MCQLRPVQNRAETRISGHIARHLNHSATAASSAVGNAKTNPSPTSGEHDQTLDFSQKAEKDLLNIMWIYRLKKSGVDFITILYYIHCIQDVAMGHHSCS